MAIRVPAAVACPSLAEWRDLLERNLADGRVREMETHLDGCLSCGEALATLIPEPPSILREAARGTDAHDEAIDEDWGRRLQSACRGMHASSGASPTGRGHAAAQADRSPLPFEHDGRYASLGRIGRGGMGEVYRAREVALDRDVAIKILPAGAAASRGAVDRLRREARRQAKLEHPNIVRIYQADEHDGSPYFAMELVTGPTLAAWLRESRRPPRRSAEIVRTVAEAVHHAHAAGIYHLDLKPANILLAPSGTPMVGDFGLARALEGEPDPHRPRIAGTYEYMAPEQWAGEPDGLDARTDVYGLGAIFHELLTGLPPFERVPDRDEMRRRVLIDEPSLQAGAGVPVPRELRTICLRCLRKRPEDRYGSARELAERLDRYLDGYPIDDCSWPRKAIYFARRRRTLVGLAGAALALSVATGGMYVASRSQGRTAQAQESFDLGQRRLSEGRSAEGLALIRRASDLLPPGEDARRDRFHRALEAWDSQLPREVASLGFASRIAAAAVSADGTRLLVGERSGEASLWKLTGQPTRAWTRPGSDPIQSVTLGAGGALCAIGTRGGSVTVLDIESGEAVTSCQLASRISSIAFLDDGLSLVTGTGDADRPLRRWRVNRGTLTEQPIDPAGLPPRQIVSLVAAPQGGRFASISFPDRCLLWDAATGGLIAALPGPADSTGTVSPTRVAFSPDGDHLVVAGEGLRLFDARDGSSLGSARAGTWDRVHAIGFQDHGGPTLVIDTGRSSVVRRGTADYEGWEDLPLDGSGGEFGDSAVGPGGLLLAGRDTNALRLFRPPPLAMRTVRLVDGSIGFARVAASADGSRLATLVQSAWDPDRDRDAGRALSYRLQIFNAGTLASVAGPIDLAGELTGRAVALSRNGGLVALGCLATQERQGRGAVFLGVPNSSGSIDFDLLEAVETDVMDLAFSDDGRMLWAGTSARPDSGESDLACWSVEERRLLWKIPCAAPIVALAASRDGSILAAGGGDGTVRFVRDGRQDGPSSSLHTDDRIDDLALSADGRLLAVSGFSGRVRVYESIRGRFEEATRLDPPGDRVSTPAFDPAGRTLHVLGRSSIYRWETRAWQPLEPAIELVEPVLGFATVPATSALAAVSRRGVLTIRAHRPPR